jgi:hypothetical protein
MALVRADEEAKKVPAVSATWRCHPPLYRIHDRAS